MIYIGTDQRGGRERKTVLAYLLDFLMAYAPTFKREKLDFKFSHFLEIPVFCFGSKQLRRKLVSVQI